MRTTSATHRLNQNGSRETYCPLHEHRTLPKDWQILWTALKVNAIAFKPDAVRSGCLSGHVSILKNQITILVSSTFIS
ncbi:MAG: hypothetical protein P8M20_12390, partial [Planctomycetaceae bacterium]|nr:hypothetical protein [Planctomycetaceae bacterium]